MNIEHRTSNVEWEKRNGSQSLPAVSLAGSEVRKFK